MTDVVQSSQIEQPMYAQSGGHCHTGSLTEYTSRNHAETINIW